MCCDTGKRWHGTGFILIHAIFVNGKEFIMGYFSEMSLDMQEGRKPSAASLTRECAFEDGENFDELPVPPADRQPVPPAAEPAPQPAFEDDEDLMRPRKSRNSLTRQSLPLKKPMTGTMPMRVRRSLPRPIPPMRTLTRNSDVPSMRPPKPNGRLSGRRNRRKRRRPCRNRWTAWPP